MLAIARTASSHGRERRGQTRDLHHKGRDLHHVRCTAPSGINPAGAISGVYVNASGVEHGFLRARDGTITTFDAPGAVNGTQPNGINPAGAIVGIAFDANFVNHGFLRAADGTFTAFDPPGSTAPLGTTAVGINPVGSIVGGYLMGSRFTASCGLPTAPSPPWIRRARQPRSPGASTQPGRSRARTLTQAARLMASCGAADIPRGGSGRVMVTAPSTSPTPFPV